MHLRSGSISTLGPSSRLLPESWRGCWIPLPAQRIVVRISLHHLPSRVYDALIKSPKHLYESRGDFSALLSLMLFSQAIMSSLCLLPLLFGWLSYTRARTNIRKGLAMHAVGDALYEVFQRNICRGGMTPSG